MEAAAEAATEAAEAARAAAEVEQAAKAATKVKGKPSQNAGASDWSAQSHSAEGVPSRTAMQRTNARLTAAVVEQAAAEQRLLNSVWTSERAAVGQAAAGRAAEQAKEAGEPQEEHGVPVRASPHLVSRPRASKWQQRRVTVGALRRPDQLRVVLPHADERRGNVIQAAGGLEPVPHIGLVPC